MPGVFVRRGEGVQRHTEDSHVGTEAKAAVMQPQAEECTGRPEASRGREGALETSVAPSEGARPCQHLSVRLLPAQTARQYIHFCRFEPPPSSRQFAGAALESSRRSQGHLPILFPASRLRCAVPALTLKALRGPLVKIHLNASNPAFPQPLG